MNNVLVVPLIVEATYTQHKDVTNSPRRRLLDRWKLVGELLSTGHTLYRLEGWVVREADGTTPPARFTRTSPIKSFYQLETDPPKTVVITVSGSQYQLTTQPTVDPTITWGPEVANPWIQGDNWVNAR